ncbi:DUF6544 family protein [Gudongella oleilytica]|uniref:DUF6544 family protein n=1 Tax=Gudongella oleilytica TaxID=1582259 RepID=UPI000EC1C3D5|nr:DUF6544 family protein [Gudongella oleilytica]MDY0256826.1 hypothetical protein [Gudongella oleilytica]HCO18963.1 hypothetical protein [Tissierellales bacterium]
MNVLFDFIYVVGVLLLIAMTVIWIGSRGFKKSVKNDLKALYEFQGEVKKGQIREKDIDHLPEAVKKWMRVSGVVGSNMPRLAVLEEKGYIRLDPEKEKWIFASAKHHIGIENPSFVWTVRAELFPGIYVHGRNHYLDGSGALQMRLLNLVKVANEEGGHKINQSSFQRYLLELPWYPYAALNPNMRWTQLDDGSAKVVISNRGISGEARFWFDEEGNVIKCSAMRYKETSEKAPLYECIGVSGNTIEFNGIRIPREVHVTWLLPKGDHTWFKVEVTKAEYK